MKALLATLLLSSAAPDVANFYNVRYSEVQEFKNGTYIVSVIWYDEDDGHYSARQLCETYDNVWKVEWGDLGEYLKAQRDVSRAASRGAIVENNAVWCK